MMTMRHAGAESEGLRELIEQVSGGTRDDLVVVEVGSYAGESASIMLDTGLVSRVYCVDPWKGGYDGSQASKSDMVEVESAFDERVGKDSRVIKVKGTLSDFLSTYRVGSSDDPAVDLVYIDACHSFEAARSDILDAVGGIRPTVAVAGHDYSAQHPGVVSAVDSVFTGGPDSTFKDGSWVVYRGRFARTKAVPRTVYQFWFPRKMMSVNRSKAFSTRFNLHVPVTVVDSNNISAFEDPNDPIHPMFDLLTPNHKSDYLRAYFLFHFGGGFADVKHYGPNNNWAECLNRINHDTGIEILGSEEWTCWTNVKEYKAASLCGHLLENSWMIGRAMTEFTREWHSRMNNLLDLKFTGYARGDKYPLNYTELQGDLFHRLCIEFYGSRAIAFGLHSGVVGGEYR